MDEIRVRRTNMITDKQFDDTFTVAGG